ncbi:Rne/Rng family ribonuclease [Pararoseomonas indoligenes]|uniref:Ribonuclease E n=1 Tax=Roseomonas indoligenes TaxID=2820811 RepID=A0A940S408_9PROT|nr:ribonuclease E/G [Pararoseomonas indoligenes]MBP0491515.1 Rne/Rng family ribonuclease [Pararoseomonas indoligenes]
MTKRMLIDASHPEETRVVVLDGNRLEDFDLETQNRRPLKGNIYLAKIVRVEPSLQAAFVEYGGNRHGFLAFGEIHPDYYQIPVADRQRLLEAQAQEDEDEDPEDEIETAAERLAPNDDADLIRRGKRGGRAAAPEASSEPANSEPVDSEPPAAGETLDESGATASTLEQAPSPEPEPSAEPATETAPAADATQGETSGEDGAPLFPAPRAQPMTMHVDRVSEGDPVAQASSDHNGDVETVTEDTTPPETVGGDSRDSDEGSESDGDDERRERRIPSRFLRHYKIQEVIRRRQIILVQVVKEERGNKGAALTTYISLPGRFSVLMPNSPKGGGVSRKISSASDRKRLREVIDEVGLPKGMGIIVRTAGAQRPKPEIRRDCEYLLSLWDSIRERTLKSMAPALVYEEADLLKRSLRDNFSKDIEEIQIEGEDAFRQARDFTRALMPQNERKIKLHRDPGMPLFARMGVEQQLDAMMSPTVQLRSGGYIVINQTEALVSIDVNSGRATRDRHIEDTALRTNLEAADEIARQLRLRDLAGLIVIDFIDMESSRNDAMVERRIKEALQQDRARIQVGRISHFGLLEMSRQRLRPSLTEHSFVTCPHCQGLGIVRSEESSALHVLRAIEEEGAKRRAAEIVVHCSPAVAMHILNRKRERLGATEARYDMCVLFEPDATLTAAGHRIDRTRPQTQQAPATAAVPALRMDYAPEPVFLPSVEDEEDEVGAAEVAVNGIATGNSGESTEETAETSGEGNGERGRRRRRRRRGGRREDGAPGEAAGTEEGESESAPVTEEGAEDAVGEAAAEGTDAGTAPRAAEDRPEGDARRGRRGRRGGNRFRREDEAPRYAGPTPADPFAGLDEALLDAMDAVETSAAEAPPRSVREIPIGEAPLPAEAPADVGAEESALGAPSPVDLPVEAPSLPEPEVMAEAAPQAVIAAPPVPEPAPVQDAVPPPAPAEAASGEATAAEATPAEPVAGTVVQPVLLGTEDTPAAPAKKGWWRR